MRTSVELALDSVLARVAGISAQWINDEIVMFNEMTNHYLALDAVTAEVWALLERPMTITDLCRALRDAFDVDSEQCLCDISTLIREMIDEELVRIVLP